MKQYLKMLPLLQSKYLLIFVLCLAFGISLFCTGVDARKRDGSDEESSQENGRRPWNKRPWDKREDKRDKKSKFACPAPFGAYPDVEDCEKYYVCTFGFAKHRKCPAFRKFDKNRKSCLSTFIAVCEDGNDETTTKATTVKDKTTPAGGKFQCPGFSGSYPHPEDCSKYYKCTFFFPSLKTCPEDQLFDGVKKECHPANEVHCGSRRRPTTIAPSTEPITPEPTTPEPTTPEPTTQEPTTPEPTTPEPTTPESTTPEPTTPEPPPPEPTTPEPTTPEPQNTPPETDCAEDDLDCIIKETGEIPSWFKCPDDIGSYRHPSSKKLFIFCINKKPFVKRCGQDMVFSDELRTCVNKVNV